LPGFVTALSDENQQTDFQSGGRSLPGNAALILPGLRLLDWPVKCPLYARAIDIFGAAHPAQQLACYLLQNCLRGPVFNPDLLR
jgi:hypothetical protein